MFNGSYKSDTQGHCIKAKHKKVFRAVALQLTGKNYILLFLPLIVMVTTGLFLAFEDPLIAYKSIGSSVNEVHGFCMYMVLVSIIVYLAGVFGAERKKESAGTVPDITNGGKRLII